MPTINLVPQWFFGFEIAIEFLFAIISVVVAGTSMYIYRIAQQRESLLFGSGFLLISLSYFTKILLNLFVLSEVQRGFFGVSFDSLGKLGIIGAYFHIILFTIGLLILTYMTFRVASARTFTLLIVLIVTLIMIAGNTAAAFVIVSSILFAFLMIHYLLEYQKTRNVKILLVLGAFSLLLLSNLSLFASGTNYYLSFIASMGMELVAYILIAFSLFLTLKRKNNAYKKNTP